MSNEITAYTTREQYGDYDAYETRDDKSYVWSYLTDILWECKNFAEARRLAKALDEEAVAIRARAKPKTKATTKATK